MNFDLTTYICFIGIPALHLHDSTYLSSEAIDVSKNISDLTQALLGESSHPFLTLKKTNIIRNPWLAMLLLAGDVQSNPGPGRSYPCTVCQRNVRNQDASVSCDKCNGWSHTVCVWASRMRSMVTSSTKTHSIYSVINAHWQNYHPILHTPNANSMIQTRQWIETTSDIQEMPSGS